MMNGEKKIKGYEKYEIESAADSLIRAKEIINDKKFYPLVKAELKRKAEAAVAATQEANLTSVVQNKLNDMNKSNNPHKY